MKILVLTFFAFLLCLIRVTGEELQSNNKQDSNARILKILCSEAQSKDQATRDSITESLIKYQITLKTVADIMRLPDNPGWVSKTLSYCKETVKSEGMNNPCGGVLHLRGHSVKLTSAQAVTEAEASLTQPSAPNPLYPEILGPTYRDSSK